MKEILINIRKIIRSVNLESKRIEKEFGVSIPQLLCLSYLDEKPGFQASFSDIKEYLQLNASTVTGIISRLEKKGMVARLPSQKDKRIGVISITTKGAQLVKTTPVPLHDVLSVKLNGLEPDKLKTLNDAFSVVIDFLDIKNIDAAPIFTSGADIADQNEN